MKVTLWTVFAQKLTVMALLKEEQWTKDMSNAQSAKHIFAFRVEQNTMDDGHHAKLILKKQLMAGLARCPKIFLFVHYVAQGLKGQRDVTIWSAPFVEMNSAGNVVLAVVMSIFNQVFSLVVQVYFKQTNLNGDSLL